jgi:hypothetical protein
MTPQGPATILELRRKERRWSQAERRWLAPVWWATVESDRGRTLMYTTGQLRPLGKEVGHA